MGPWVFGTDPRTRQYDNWNITVKTASKMDEDELQELPPRLYLDVKKALEKIPRPIF